MITTITGYTLGYTIIANNKLILCARFLFQTSFDSTCNNDHQRSRGGRRWPRATSPLAVQPPSRDSPQPPYVVRGTFGVLEICGSSIVATVFRTVAHARVPAAIAETGTGKPPEGAPGVVQVRRVHNSSRGLPSGQPDGHQGTATGRTSPSQIGRPAPSVPRVRTSAAVCGRVAVSPVLHAPAACAGPVRRVHKPVCACHPAGHQTPSDAAAAGAEVSKSSKQERRHR